MENRYFHLYSSIKFTRGKYRSLVLDMQHNYWVKVPNSFVEVLEMAQNEGLKVVYSTFNEEIEILEEYFSFALKKGWGRWFNEKSAIFNEIGESYHSYERIETSLIDISKETNLDWVLRFIELLDLFHCHHVEFRFLDSKSTTYIESILDKVASSNIKCVTLCLSKNNFIDEERVKKLITEEGRIIEVYFYNNKIERVVRFKQASIYSLTSKAVEIDKCGVIQQNKFIVNPRFYRLSEEKNSCLYKKLSLTYDGIVCICPSVKSGVLGYMSHLDSSDVESFLSSMEYMKLSDSKKSEIHVCRDCEFRNCCLDCRGHKSNSDLFTKPKFCSYSPKTEKWEAS